jgi:hypothetical protein
MNLRIYIALLCLAYGFYTYAGYNGWRFFNSTPKEKHNPNEAQNFYHK